MRAFAVLAASLTLVAGQPGAAPPASGGGPLPCKADGLRPAGSAERMLVACADHSLRVIETPGGRVLRAFDRADFGFAAGAERTNAAVSPDGTRVALAFRDGSVAVWDVAGPGPPTVWKGGFYPNTLVFTPDGHGLFANETLLDVGPVMKVRARLSTDFDSINDVVVSPDGRRAALPAADTKVRLYDTATWRQLAEYAELSVEPFTAVFVDGGRRLVVGAADGGLTVLDAATLRRQAEVAGPPGFYVDGLIAAGPNGVAVHYHPADGRGEPKAARLDLKTLTLSPDPPSATVDAAVVRGGKLWFLKIEGARYRAWTVEKPAPVGFRGRR